jgi:hypothetical protein
VTCSIADAHPELMHYTDLGGLLGILESQVLSATHALNLNDKTEIVAFRKRLPEVLRPGVRAGLTEFARRPSIRKIVETLGGLDAVIENAVTTVPAAMFAALLGDGTVPTATDAFILSFSTPAIPLIAQHGLLSQWRSYGKGDGYALVSQTALLDPLLAEEGKRGTSIYSAATSYIQPLPLKNCAKSLRRTLQTCWKASSRG